MKNLATKYDAFASKRETLREYDFCHFRMSDLTGFYWWERLLLPLRYRDLGVPIDEVSLGWWGRLLLSMKDKNITFIGDMPGWWERLVNTMQRKTVNQHRNYYNLAVNDYLVAVRSLHALKHIKLHEPISLSEYCAYLGFQAGRLAKSLLMLHDAAYVNFSLPDFVALKPEELPITENKQVIASNEFFKRAFDHFTKIDALTEDEDRLDQLIIAKREVQQAFWSGDRLIPSRANHNAITVERFVEDIQYSALMSYFDHAMVCFSEHKSVYYTPPPKTYSDYTLSELLQHSVQFPHSPVKQFRIDQDIIASWAEFWSEKIRHLDELDIWLEDRVCDQIKPAFNHIMIPRYSVENDFDPVAQHWAATISSQFDHMQKSFKSQIIRADIYLWDQFSDAQIQKELDKGIPRPLYYDQVSVREQVFFRHVLRDKLCNNRSRGLWQGVTEPEHHQYYRDSSQQKQQLSQLITSPFDRIRVVAERLQTHFNQPLLEHDRQFYEQLQSFLHYLPNPEFTIEYRMLYAQTEERTAEHQPCDYLANLVDALITLYSESSCHADQRRLRCFMNDMTEHQLGKAVLDVRTLYRKASLLYQTYSSIGQKILGWSLVVLGATLLLAGMASTALLLSSASWMLAPTFQALSSLSSLSQPTLHWLLPCGAVLLSLPILLAAKSCVSNRPFFRPSRFDLLAFKASEIHPVLQYLYLTDTDNLAKYTDFYRAFCQAVNTDIELDDQDSKALATVNHQEHWCHERDGDGFRPVDTLEIVF